MADHASRLMASIEAVLLAQMPLAGGWHTTRLETPTYPVGYIDLTRSVPGWSGVRRVEQHRGIISIWTKAAANAKPNPRQAMALTEQAHIILAQAVLSVPGLTVSRFVCGERTPQNPDGLIWGRSFIFTAKTSEAPNGTNL